MIAALNVPYGPEAKSISRPDTLALATIDPTPPASRCGSAASTRPTVPIRSTSKLARQFSALSGMASALTLATTPSSPPQASAVPETHAASAAASRTSTADPIAVAPSAVSAACVSATAAAVRAQYATAAPSASSPSTTARPMPRVPPVTQNRLPDSPRSIVFLRISVRNRAQRPCGATQLTMRAAIGNRRGQYPLVDLGDGAVVGVDDIGDRHLRYLGEQLVGVEAIQPVQLAQPGDHLDLT